MPLPHHPQPLPGDPRRDRRRTRHADAPPPVAGMRARHALYRRLAVQLRSDPRVPETLRASRFFEAAACVTGPRALGLLPWLARLGLVDADSQRHLEAINAWLLERNLRLLHALLRCGPADAGPGGGAALAFDRALVVFEQRALDAYLQRHAMSDAARRGIDRLLAACGNPHVSRLFGIDPRLARAVGRGGSFFALETRVGIGHALVRELHDARRG